MTRRDRGFTLIELMVIISLIAIVGAIAYPRISDTMRKLRARDGAKSIVNAFVVAKAEAAIRNVAFQITLTPSLTVGSLDNVNGGGSIVTMRAGGTSCASGGLVQVDRFSFAELKDVNLCLVRTSSGSEVTTDTACSNQAVNFCVTPDGTITNLTSGGNVTMAFIRENEVSTSGAVAGAGVIRQVVIPRRKAVRVNSIQVTDVCL